MHRATLFLSLLLAPAVARADSDGYYCTGRGYIAWETRLDHPGHQLHIVRFSRDGGLARLAPVALEEFQVHGMKCGDVAVELTGGGKVHTVDLSDATRPVVSTRVASGSASAPQLNLGHWSREGVIDLESDAALGEFQLVISKVSRPVSGGVDHYTVTQVVRRDPAAGLERIQDSIQVFEGIFRETGG